MFCFEMSKHVVYECVCHKVKLVRIAENYEIEGKLFEINQMAPNNNLYMYVPKYGT